MPVKKTAAKKAAAPKLRPVIVCTERWVGVADAPGYEVSSHGRVRSFWSTGCRPKMKDEARLLSLYVDDLGYSTAYLSSAHKRYSRKVHHLVLEAFHGPRPDGTECRHLDGNPRNNRAENLSWGTHQENVADRKRHGTDRLCGLKGEAHLSAKLTYSDVARIKKLRRSGVGVKVIAELFGIHNSNVSRIANGRTWKSDSTA